MNLIRPNLSAALVGFLFLLVLTQWGCVQKQTGAETTVLRFAINEDPRSMEPGLSILLQDSILALNLHMGLFKYDRDSVLRPYLVREWSLSKDRLTYTFVLHDNWKWHNGRVITAADIKKGWERYLDPKVGAWGAGYLTSIDGARELLNGTAVDLKGVEASDLRTLKVTLTHDDPLFLMRLGATPTWTVPPEAVAKAEAKWIANPQGGGPFKFVEWQPHSRVKLEVNPGFAGSRPALNGAEFLIVPDAMTALNMYRSGELDVAPVSASGLPSVKQDPKLSRELQYWPSAQLVFIGLNKQRVRAFEDPRVREAFTYAIDRKTICDEVLFGAWTAALEIVPPGVPGHTGKLGLNYDPEQARKLMSEAGFADGRGFPAIQLATVGSTETTAAEAVAAQLGQNIGVKVEVRRLEPNDFYEGLRAKRWDAFLAGWTADYLSAEQWLYRLLHTGSDTNFVGYSNADFDAIVDKAMRAVTEEEQKLLWEQSNQIATADSVLIPLAYGRYIFLVKPNISGFAANIFGQIGFEAIHKNANRGT